MRTFIEEGMKYNAAQGCHDERVDTAGMASVTMKLLPRKLRGFHSKEGGIVNWQNQQKHESSYQEVYA